MKRFIKIFSAIAVLLLILSAAGIWVAGRLVEKNALGKVYNSTEEIPHNKIGLLLGTGKNLSNGRMNLYYKYRIEAAAQLFHSGKIDYFLDIERLA
jgi:SanA protein